MSNLQIFEFMNGGEKRKAVLVSTFPPPKKEESALVSILMGQDPDSSELLKKVEKGAGSIPDLMGAEFTIILAIKKEDVPEGGFGVGGVYGIGNWVTSALDAAMPEGFGAAMTQPAIFPKEISGGVSVYLVVISPMNRSRTDIKRAFIAEPHGDGPSVLLHT